MNEALKVWEKRRQEYWTLAVKYLRLIGNSGFLFTIYILFLFGSYYYGQFLEWLPETFPAVLFFTLFFTWIVTRGRVRTFLKQADVVFLLPMESRLKKYFRASLKYSWMMEAFWVTLAFLLLAPLFNDRIASGGGILLSVLLAIFLLKLWNLAASFEEQRIQDDRKYKVHLWLRACLNAGVLYLLFSFMHVIWTAGAALLLAAIYQFYFSRISGSLQWERLIRIENNTVRTFFRVANNFTDVPHLKQSIKERTWLSFLYRLVPYSRENAYRYLFGRAMIRSGDYFGIYIRLTVLGMIFLAAVDISWGMWLLAGLFAYMTVIQLETLAYHFQTSQMLPLYPLKTSWKLAGVKFWIWGLGLLQAVCFIIIAAGEWLNAVIILIITLGMYFYGINYRLPGKIAAD
ncbi:ABC transporter permease [Alkalicoccus daliensis]|uniref:ABC-2 type transport system permease protein n=1 Tax=Alkalicoccus daliensis TaxID=745820 RepID=A0A1H0IFT7_9BACI|nr:ABC transporter permease [Alkalicoccus daliensis]SDO30317.1 ABC-2 type transport system permease protein [Alkalicoccus daliensis]